MSDPITLGGTDYRPAVILIPIRLRLRSAYVDAEGSSEALIAVCGAVLGQALPDTLGESPSAQRRALRADVIDYGERVVDALLGRGVKVPEIIQTGSRVLLDALQQIPKDDEIEESAGNSPARAETSTGSISASG
jgi:hypothetical protein